MSTYIYKVRDTNGKVMQGHMDAVDGKDLRKKLDEQNYFIIEYTEKKSKKDLLSMEIMPSAVKVKMADISIFSWQLFTMLDAGLTLVNGLKIIISQTKTETIKSAMVDVCQRVEEGTSFSEALKAHPKIFSKFYVHMVNAGEVGGVLDEMLKRLAEYYERQAEISTKVKSATVYPVLLLTISVGVIIFLVTVVLPQFAGIFRDIGAEIPAPTQFLLSVSVTLKKTWMFQIGVIAAVVFFVKLYIKSERGRLEFDHFMLRIPVIGGIVRKTLTARFTGTLSTLVSGGIPILTSLDVVTETIGNKAVTKVLRDVSVSVGEGKPIAQPLAESGIFPDMMVNMIRVGEETGSLEKMLDKVAEFYNREVNVAIDTFTKLIEPLLMVCMAGIIGFIAISIFMPLANLMQTLRG